MPNNVIVRSLLYYHISFAQGYNFVVALRRTSSRARTEAAIVGFTFRLRMYRCKLIVALCYGFA